MPGLKKILQTVQKVGPIVNLGYASYMGTSDPDTGIDSFLGIRYAAPPIGELRFQYPQFPLLERDIVQADKLPYKCPQANHSNPYLSSEYDGDEDCLFLNIYKPTTIEEGQSLPVMVYIHEGGYARGSVTHHDPSFLLKLSNLSMIAVTIQYRLGAFGFLASDEVAMNGVLNAGLLDQQTALEWVQRYIHDFGGDKDQVTIWGLSSGGGSVLNHIVSYNGSLGTGLFRRAIANSPFLPPLPEFDSPISQRNYDAFVWEAGCSGAEDTFACLVETDTETLKQANAIVSASGPYGTFAWVPVFDDSFFTSRPTEQLLTGRINGEKLITGSQQHETLMTLSPKSDIYTFIPNNITTKDQFNGYLRAQFPEMSESLYSMIEYFYPEPENENTYDDDTEILDNYKDETGRIAALTGEAILNCPAYWLAEAFPPGNSFLYEWQIPPATHGMDMVAIFPDDYPSPAKLAPLRFAYALPLISFIVYGDPNTLPKQMFGAMAPHWSPYYPGGVEAILTVRGPVIGSSNEDGKEERCAFWRGLGSIIPY